MSFFSNQKYKLFAYLLVPFAFLLNTTTSFATELDRPAFSYNGFATLGLSKSDNDLLGARDTIAQDGEFDNWSSSHYSKLGLQLNYSVSDRVSAGAQLVAKKRDVLDSLGNAIHWAYLDFDMTPSTTLRVGRMGQDNYMVSDYREVGHAQLWARAPMEFYSYLTTEHKDGIQFRHSTPVKDGVLFTKFGINEAKSGTVKNNSSGVLTFKPDLDLSIEWENQTWHFRFSHNRGKIKSLDAGIANLQNILRNAVTFGWSDIEPYIDDFDLNDRWLRYYSFGIAYRDNGWIIQSEVSHANSNSELFSNLRSGYVLVGKRFGAITPFVTAAKSKNKLFKVPSSPIPFTALQESLIDLVNATGIDQTSLGLGFRWDISGTTALKAQWDRTWVKADGAYYFDFDNKPTSNQTVNQFTLTVDIVF